MNLLQRSAGLSAAVLSPERRAVVILANPKAGTRSCREAVNQLVAALHRRRLQATICWKPEDLSPLVAEQDDRLRCVVAAGGDGTLAEVLNRVPGVPVALMPLGHENLAARFFRYRRCGQFVAETIAAGGLAEIDLVQCTSTSPSSTGNRAESRVFSLMAGAGFDADVVHRLHGGRTGHVNRLVYAQAISESMRKYHFPQLAIEFPDKRERLIGSHAFVFNLPEYGMRLPLGRGADPQDGLLDVWVFERRGIRAMLRYFLGVVCGCRSWMRDIHFRRTARVELRSEESVRLQVDGDPAGHLPAQIEALPGAGQFVVPAWWRGGPWR